MASGGSMSRVSGLEVHAPAVVVAATGPGLLLLRDVGDSVSVVRTIAAMEAAFWSAERVTLAASTMPFSNMSPYSPLRAS